MTAISADNTAKPMIRDVRVIDDLDHLFESLTLAITHCEDSKQQEAIFQQFDTLRKNVIATADQLQATENKSAALARAQADAIVYSAEVINELEETKLRLCDARAAAEKAASDTQRLADTIFARTHDTVLVLHNGVCVSCNDNAIALFGCVKTDIIGSWPRPLTASFLEGQEETARRVQSLYKAALAGDTGGTEVGCYRQDGRLVWCELKMTGFRMHEGTHVLLTVCDISSRKEFEEELRRYRDFLNNIINAVPDPLYVSNQEQQLVIANDSYCASFEVQREDIIGRNMAEVFPQDKGHARHAANNTLATLTETTDEERIQRHGDGTTRIHSIRRSTFKDAVSGTPYIVGISRDITQERKRQERLSLLASVFNNAAEGVAILARDGRIVEANPRLIQMFSCDNLAGKRLNSVIDLSITDLANELVRVSLGTPWAGKVAAQLPSGEQHWYWLSLSRNDKSDDPDEQLIALFSDVTQLENSQRQLQRQAQHDNLTGLPNRRFFRTYVEDLIKRQQLQTESFSICFMDLDEFKGINDSLGHAIGDQLLIKVAERLTEAIGSQAFIARFGGDEFAAVFPQRRVGDESPEVAIESLIQAFRQPFTLGQNEVLIGMSIGIASYPYDGNDVDSLMSSADIAMYAAKDAGKNHARQFSSEMQERADQRHFLQSELRKVLQGGGLSLAFQPKVCAQTGIPRGCEALARWKRPDGSMIPPSDFIPIAEQSGVILELGEFVIGKTLETCRKWMDREINLFPVAVNISPSQLRSPYFVERLIDMLAEHDAQPEWLELEITENAMVEDIEQAISTINRLGDLGFRIAIDDFGTGYSSLSYLRYFQIHTLKIDRSFVSEINTDRNCAAIAHSILSLGQGLGLTVVAEGVETAEQQQFLAEAGCDILQGYHIGRPMSVENIEQWLTALNSKPICQAIS